MPALERLRARDKAAYTARLRRLATKKLTKHEYIVLSHLVVFDEVPLKTVPLRVRTVVRPGINTTSVERLILREYIVTATDTSLPLPEVSLHITEAGIRAYKIYTTKYGFKR